MRMVIMRQDCGLCGKPSRVQPQRKRKKKKGDHSRTSRRGSFHSAPFLPRLRRRARGVGVLAILRLAGASSAALVLPPAPRFPLAPLVSRGVFPPPVFATAGPRSAPPPFFAGVGAHPLPVAWAALAAVVRRFLPALAIPPVVPRASRFVLNLSDVRHDEAVRVP